MLGKDCGEQMMDGQCCAEPRHVHVMCMITVITLHAAGREAGSPAAGSGRAEHRWGQLVNYLGGKPIKLNPHQHHLTKSIPDGLRGEV